MSVNADAPASIAAVACSEMSPGEADNLTMIGLLQDSTTALTSS